MANSRWALRHMPLRNLLLGFLAAYGLVPILIAGALAVFQNRDTLETQERVVLAHRVEAISLELDRRLGDATGRLRQLGHALLVLGDASMSDATRHQAISRLLADFAVANPQLLDLRVRLGAGPEAFAASHLQSGRSRILDGILASGPTAGRFVELPDERGPGAAVVVSPDDGAGKGPRLAALIALPLEPTEGTRAFLIDAGGSVLWAQEPDAASVAALEGSAMVSDFVGRPTVQVAEYVAHTPAGEQRLIAQISPVGDAGWGVVVQQPKSLAFGGVRRVVQTTLLAMALMMVLALVFALGASNVMSAAIRRVAGSARAIAGGDFAARVEGNIWSRELSELGETFNIMGGHLEESVERLRQAARKNHDLFLGSIRALLAAVEAKEPYIRGHSERVASFSRAIGFEMSLRTDVLERLWVTGLLHDIGKIGIEDRILNKGDILTPDEFETMKRHTLMGAEIMSSIEQLSYSIDVVRSHHERWNGGGYPDALVGEAIPVMARVVAVADSFDAMTTQRVYQDPMTGDQAADWIRSEAGKSFDPVVAIAFDKAYAKGVVRPPEQPRARRSEEAAIPEATLHS